MEFTLIMRLYVTMLRMAQSILIHRKATPNPCLFVLEVELKLQTNYPHTTSDHTLHESQFLTTSVLPLGGFMTYYNNRFFQSTFINVKHVCLVEENP